MSLLPSQARLKALCGGLLLASAGGSFAQEPSFEELVLSTSLLDQAPVPVVVYKQGESYYIPMSQATSLRLPNAKQKVVKGLPEPVIDELSVQEADEENLQASVPISYFNSYTVEVQGTSASKRLRPIPAAWIQYDLFGQDTPGQRLVGGTLDLTASHQGWTLKNLWQLSRSHDQDALLRASTLVQKSFGSVKLSVGDIPLAESLPVLTTRQGLGAQVSGSFGSDAAAPGLRLRGEVPGSGMLRVFANQQELFRTTTRVGTYEVLGLPRMPGSAKYTVYFDNGTSVRLLDSLESLESMTLLPEGRGEYRLFAGVPRVLNTLSEELSYEKDALVEAHAGYGLSKFHSVDVTLLSSAQEKWVGGGIRSEWGSNLFSQASSYFLKGAAQSGVLTTLGAHYSTREFRAGASHAWFSNEVGTPIDGFVSESKLFAGWNGWSLYWLKNRYVTDLVPGAYYTTGLHKSIAWGKLNMTFTLSRTVRDGKAEDPYVAVLLNYTMSPQQSLSATVTDKRLNVEHDYRTESWGVSSRLSSSQNETTGGASGFYQGAYGTIFGTAEQSGQNSILGASGGFVLFALDGKLSARPSANQPGDSLLVVDTGAPGSTVVLESVRRFKADGAGHVAIPMRSRIPQRVELDLKSLPYDKDIEVAQLMAETFPFEAAVLKFDTKDLGFPVYLVNEEGSPLEEGSVAYLAEGPAPVVSKGMVWLDQKQDRFKVQTKPGKFCAVENVTKSDTFTCKY